MPLADCKIVNLPKIADPRGNLTFIEAGRHVPFEFRRVYYLYDVPGGGERGGHAHRGLSQLIMAMSGSFDVILDDGQQKQRYHLNRSYYGLYVCPMIWRSLDNFSSGSVCMVLASNFYDEADYYRDYDQVLQSPAPIVTSVQSPSAELAVAQRRTYGQIVKSSALIGGSSILTIGCNIIRTKAMALLLGPSGVGLLGLYGSVADVTRSLAGLGVNSSGVRQIAEAVGSQDSQRIARTVLTLRRVAFYTGALGGLLLLLFRYPISRLTFQDELHAGALGLLALAVFFGDVSAGQAALVQGMRRIADLARMNVLGALYGTIFSIPIIYFMGERGVVPSLVVVAGMGILTSWWYARKVKVDRVTMSWKEMANETSALLRMGFVFMSSGLMTMGVAYFVRLVVVRQLNLEAAGYYQAAWALGGLYFGFILQAMGADFYPRLTAVARDHVVCNRLVNEQAEVGLLLAGPGVLATLTFAPLVIELFYSHHFGPTVGILRWICLGMMLRVASWPMGFILLAKGMGKLFFWTELLANTLQVVLIWSGVRMFGLDGTGIAFFALYIVYGIGIYLVVRRVSGFRWSGANRKLALVLVPAVALVFGAWYCLPQWAVAVLGLAATLLTGVYFAKILCTLVPLDKIPAPALKLLRLLRLAPPGSDA